MPLPPISLGGTHVSGGRTPAFIKKSGVGRALLGFVAVFAAALAYLGRI
jgi:hypothetical protein